MQIRDGILDGTRTFTETELEQARRDWEAWIRARHAEVASASMEEARHADHVEPM